MFRRSDINWLYFKYYSDNPELRRIVWIHSTCVAKKALQINEKKKLGLNPQDIYLAAMLHDIGVVKCNAPDIHANGSLPYICHGIEGKKILDENGLGRFSRICSCHTGSGITAKEIIGKSLPLPPQDFLPSSPLEKLICYSDKFFSKNHDLTREKPIEEVISQMSRFGEPSLNRFLSLHRQFGELNS